MKKIALINGHPNPSSFNYALADAYAKGLRYTEAEILKIDLTKLDFNPVLKYGYNQRQEMEPDLEEALQKIQKADHLVWVFPVWWYGIPALMKGFIDRLFLPGIAFEYVNGSAFPKKLWKGKTARLIMTSDTPYWYYKLVMKSSVTGQFKKGTLQFCGINPVKMTYISVIKNASNTFRTKWLSRIQLLGEKQL